MAVPQHIDRTLGQDSAPFRVARIVSVTSTGGVVAEVDGQSAMVDLATHVTQVVPGQRVVVLMLSGETPLVTAAYPLSSSTAAESEHPSKAAIGFDPDSGTLNIRVNQLNLDALGAVEIRCGEAVLRLTAQGNVVMQGQAITQSAIGPYQIEGASIDLN